jgi:hypothetical protein
VGTIKGEEEGSGASGEKAGWEGASRCLAQVRAKAKRAGDSLPAPFWLFALHLPQFWLVAAYPARRFGSPDDGEEQWEKLPLHAVLRTA